MPDQRPPMGPDGPANLHLVGDEPEVPEENPARAHDMANASKIPEDILAKAKEMGAPDSLLIKLRSNADQLASEAGDKFDEEHDLKDAILAAGLIMNSTKRFYAGKPVFAVGASPNLLELSIIQREHLAELLGCVSFGPPDVGLFCYRANGDLVEDKEMGNEWDIYTAKGQNDVSRRVIMRRGHEVDLNKCIDESYRHLPW